MDAPSAALRRGLWLVGSLAFVLVGLELGAGVVYRVRTGRSLDPEAMRAQAAEARAAGPAQRGGGPVSKLTLHPYLGFVYDPAVQPGRVNALGFRGEDPLQDPGEDAFVVGVFGGSVAMLLPAEMLARKLGALSAAEGRRVVVRNFGVSGYKQPQQLLALTLLLTLGVRLDAVVNLDGFNEIVLPEAENLRAGIHPVYPRRWRLYALESFDEQVVGPMARIGDLQASRARWHDLLAHPVLGRSRFVALLATTMTRRIEARLLLADEELRERLGAADGYRATGPPFAPREPGDRLEELVRIWADGSEQMARLCAANGIAYAHFLQPNQYVAGSKTFTEREREEALGPGSYGYRRAATAGYGRLISRGRELARAGVPFADLTPVFRDEADTVYVDTCCHFNELGYEHVTDAIARRVAAEAERIRRHGSSSSPAALPSDPAPVATRG